MTWDQIKFLLNSRLHRYRYRGRRSTTHAVFGPIHRVVTHDPAGNRRRFALRAGTSDFPVFLTTLVDRQYDISGFKRHEDVAAHYRAILAAGRRPLIIDGGANIGFASYWFRELYPEALIVAVEPQPDNHREMVALMGEDALFVPLRAALANSDGAVDLVDPGLGAVGFRTEARAGDAREATPAYRLASLVALAREKEPTRRVEPFILKIDIEGFERDLFDDPDTFDAFYLAFIELHDWMLPRERSSASFLKLVAALDRDFLLHGENVVSVKN